MRKSGIAALLELKPKGKSDDDAPDSESDLGGDDDESTDYDAAADELFDALKSDDRKAFATALKAAVMACQES